MGKIFKIVITLITIVFSAAFLYPTYRWFFGEMDSNLRLMAVQPREYVSQQSRIRAEWDVQALEQAIREDDILPESVLYFKNYAKKIYKKNKVKIPSVWTPRDIVRFTQSRDELLKFARIHYGEEALRAKATKEKAFNLGLDLAGGLGATLQAGFDPLVEKLGRDATAQEINEAMQSALDAIRNRADRFGATEPNIRRQGNDQILIELPGEEDPDAISRLIIQQGSLAFHLVNTEQTNYMNQYLSNNPSSIELIDVRSGRFADASVLAEDFLIFPYSTRDRFGEEEFRGYYVLESSISMDGEHIRDVRIGNTEFGEPTVNFSLDNEGALIFSRLTSDNVGRQLAVVMEGGVKSVANITGPIPGGNVQVSGFTPLEAQQLSVVLKSSGLPIDLNIINVQTVGPTLGAESIRSGVQALIFGFGLIVLFAVLYYRGAGVQASFTLFLNLLFTLALLSSIGFTLTLTSMAGIILNVGMAIDANVLIFERIKEELHAGYDRRTAIERGFSRAFSAIFDSNITTFIVAIFLSQMGSGPVRGFAITLAIGILTNLFTAIYISRLLFDIGTDWFKIKKLSIGYNIVAKTLESKNKVTRELRLFPFLRVAKIVTPMGLLVLLGLWIGVFAHKGFNVGIDFSAGLSMNVFVDGQSSVTSIEEALGDINNVKVVDVDENGYFRISVSDNKQNDFKNVTENKVIRALQESFGGVEVLSTEFVGASLSKDTASGAIKAILGSLSLIILYLWLRFKRFSFSIATIIGTIHDIIFVIGAMGAFYFEIESATVAAILAILAYSLNDSIVIFDRIRENSQKLSFGGHTEDIINGSLTQSFTRTILTTTSTMLAILPLIFIAGGSVRLFAIKMLIGISVGTYSSIFISSLIYYYFTKKRPKEHKSSYSKQVISV